MSLGKYITIITFGVANLKRSTLFYESLGWQRSSMSQESITFIQLNGVVLGLYPRDELAKDACVQNTSFGFSGVTVAHNVNSEDEVDRILEFARSMGAKITKPGQKVFWGGYSGYFSDPDGYLWEVAYNPFATLDDAGRMHLPE